VMQLSLIDESESFDFLVTARSRLKFKGEKRRPTFTKPVVSSPNRSFKVKHSPGGRLRSFIHAAINLKAAAFGFFASDTFSSTCNGSAGRRAL
jgi:hypothetical protein